MAGIRLIVAGVLSVVLSACSLTTNDDPLAPFRQPLDHDQSQLALLNLEPTVMKQQEAAGYFCGRLRERLRDGAPLHSELLSQASSLYGLGQADISARAKDTCPEAVTAFEAHQRNQDEAHP